MNRRIKELKDQCYISVIDRDGDNEYDMEKFADLLLTEFCREIRNQELTIPICGYWMNKVAENIEKRFEVNK